MKKNEGFYIPNTANGRNFSHGGRFSFLLFVTMLFSALCGEAQNDSCLVAAVPLTVEVDTSENLLRLPACWIVRNTDTASTAYLPYRYYGSNVWGVRPHDYLTFPDAFSMIALPPIDTAVLHVGQLCLSFSASRSGYALYTPTIEVGIWEDTCDLASFVPLKTLHHIPNTAQPYWVSLAGYQGQGNRVALKITDSHSNWLCGARLSDINLYPLTDCLPPYNLYATQLTDTSLVLHWENSVSLPDGCHLRYRQTGDSVWTSVPVAPQDLSLPVTGLSPHTLYEFCLIPDCDTSLASPMLSVSTYCAGIDSLPWACDFGTDSSTLYSTPVLPDCWMQIGRNPATIHIQQYTEHFLALSDYQQFSTWVILPPVNTSAHHLADLQVSFRMRSSGYQAPEYGLVEVGVMEDPADSSSFVPIESITHVPSSWSAFEIPLSGYAGSGRHIAIRSDGTVEIHIDDMSIDTISACPRPCILQVDNVTLTSADLSWSGYNAQHPDFAVQYKRQSDTAWESLSFVADSSQYTLTDLQPLSQYSVRVVAGCDTSKVSETVTFNTACGTIGAVPASWDFETNNIGGTPNRPQPACWTVYNPDAAWVIEEPSYAHSGSRHLRFSAAGRQFLVLPEIDTTVLEINKLQLSFYARSSNSTHPTAFTVGVMTSPDDTASFQPVNTVTQVQSDYRLFTLPLDAYGGNGTFVALRFVGETNTFRFIDDVVLDTVPACPRINEVTVSDITPNSAVIRWLGYRQENPQHTFYYRKEGDEQWETQTVSLSGPQYTLAGLDHSSRYECRFAAGCAPDSLTSVMTFSTACDLISEMPVRWDFETNNTSGTASAPLPACWSRADNTYPYVYNTAGQALSGSHALRLYCQASRFGILPPVDTLAWPLRELQLSFYIKGTVNASATPPTILLGALTDPSDTSTFEVIDTLPPLNANYKLVDIPLGSYTGNGTCLALNVIPGYPMDFFTLILIDDMILYPAPSCPRPSNLAATHSTTSSIELNWDHNVDSARYVIHYKSANGVEWFADTTGFLASGTYTAAGLQPNTVYQFVVEALCNPCFPTDTVVAATVCGYMDSMPQFWDFEEYDDSLRMPECWRKIRSANDNGFPRIWPDANYAHNSGASFNFFRSSGTYVILPALNDTIAARDLRLSFYARKGSSDYWSNPELEIEVGVMSNPYDPMTYTPVQSIDNFQYDYQYFDLHLSSYTGDGKYICIKDVTTPNSGDIYIDDLTLDYIPVCHLPENLVASEVTSHSARLHWTGFDSYYPDYIVHYRPSGGGTWMEQSFSATSPSFLLDGLSPDTPYEVFLTHSCDESTPSGTLLFTTGCQPFDSIHIFNLSDVAVTLAVTGAETDDTLVVHYRPVDGDEWQTALLTGDNPTLPGLSPSTSYELFVTRTCNAEEPSDTLLFTTDCGRIRSLPRIWDFEDDLSEDTHLPLCWWRFSGSNFPSVISTHSHSGSNALRFKPVCAAVLPRLDDSIPANTVTVSFYAKVIAITASAGSTVEVGVLEDLEDESSFTAVGTVDVVSAIHQEYTVPLSNYTGSGKTIVLRCSTATASTLYVDDVQLRLTDGSGVGIGGYGNLDDFVRLYPNPAREYIDIRFSDDNVAVQRIEVCDVYGKVVQTTGFQGNPTRTDVSMLSSGVYFVRIISDRGVFAKGFIKK